MQVGWSEGENTAYGLFQLKKGFVVDTGDYFCINTMITNR